MIKMFQIDSIEAKRFIKPENMMPEVRIDNNSTITSVKLIESSLSEIGFRFTTTYSGIGIISLEGILIYEGESKKLNEEWSKKHRIPDEIVNEIHGTILNNCIIEAICISKEVRLPPPTPPPAQMLAPQKPLEKKPEGYA